MQDFNNQEFRIGAFGSVPVKACCQFKYKGYEVSMSTIFDSLKVAVFELVGNPDDPVGLFNTVECAIKWIDMQQEPVDLRQGRELSLCQFKGTDGKWLPFLHEQHYIDTKADADWPIRYLSVD